VSTHDANADATVDVRQPQAPAEELSLRELYLILRRRSPWILLAALIVALLTYAYVSTRPPSYLAEVTTVVARPPIEVDLGTNLRFRPEVTVSFETYSTLAFSRGVLESVLPHHERTDVNSLEAALELERLTGTAAAETPFLAVVHQARSADPDAAAATVTAWVEATIATVRSLLLENLDTVELFTGDALTSARERVEEAETALERFRAEFAPESLRARLNALDSNVVELEHEVLLLERDIAGRSFEREAFALQREDVGGGLGVVLVDAPEVVIEVDGAISSLDARLGALRGERELLTGQLHDLAARRGELSAALADATVRLGGLERAVREARASLEMLAALDPNVAYIAQLAPAGVRVLSEAAAGDIELRRGLLLALLAGVATAFLGVVVALLAEAVRAPTGDGAGRGERVSPEPTGGA
jgi:uncharacterized protein involved in exopolysaccharide biosynthesis